MQRAIAARSLKHAQTGLMVGGVLKYFMAVIIIIPGIALYGIMDQPLSDPDMAFPYIVNNYIPIGLKGLILCGLFASLMSTVDSTFNSIATLWSIDIYSVYINKKANEYEKVNSGRKAIIYSFFTATFMGLVLLYLKFENSNGAFTHTLNELRYYINAGIVVLICSSIIIVKPNHKYVLFGFLITLPLNFLIQSFLPEINYFMRAFIVIVVGLSISLYNSSLVRLKDLFYSYSIQNSYIGILLLISLVLIHIVFH